MSLDRSSASYFDVDREVIFAPDSNNVSGGPMNRTTVSSLSPDRDRQKRALLKGPGPAAVRYGRDQFTPDHCSAPDLGEKVASPRRDPGQSSWHCPVPK